MRGRHEEFCFRQVPIAWCYRTVADAFLPVSDVSAQLCVILTAFIKCP